MKINEVLQQLDNLKKRETQLERIANVMFNDKELSDEIGDKAVLTETPFFIISDAKRIVHNEIERIRTVMNEIEFDIY